MQVRDKQIVRLIGKIPGLAAAAYHKHTARRPAATTQVLHTFHPSSLSFYSSQLMGVSSLFPLGRGASRPTRART